MVVTISIKDGADLKKKDLHYSATGEKEARLATLFMAHSTEWECVNFNEQGRNAD